MIDSFRRISANINLKNKHVSSFITDNPMASLFPIKPMFLKIKKVSGSEVTVYCILVLLSWRSSVRQKALFRLKTYQVKLFFNSPTGQFEDPDLRQGLTVCDTLFPAGRFSFRLILPVGKTSFYTEEKTLQKSQLLK